MSKKRALDLTLGAVGLLLLATGGFIVISQRHGGDTAVQLEVAARQQTLIEALVVHADSLETGTERDRVLATRTALGATIVSFDQGLGALLVGGPVAFDDGHTRLVSKVGEVGARQALEQASQLWVQTGMPLGEEAREAMRRLEAGEDPEQIEAELGDLFGDGDNPGGLFGQGRLTQLRRRLAPPEHDETLYPL